jgi:hypothetical protein
MKTTVLLASWLLASSRICLGFMVKKVNPLMIRRETLKTSQQIMTRVIHSIVTSRSRKKESVDIPKAISNLVTAGSRLKSLVRVLCLSKLRGFI